MYFSRIAIQSVLTQAGYEMNVDFVNELRWRGMVHDMTPGTDQRLRDKPSSGYAGFDPTGPSLHIGHLIPIMMLVHLQRSGHTPVALVGGATAMVGDPSGKSGERELLSLDEIRHNQACIRAQLEHFLDFTGELAAEVVNNYDWFAEVRFLDFLRDVGKHLTVNYMVAKDSVKSRWDAGISFTEFSYQLLQAYDFYWLYRNKDCVLQLGGSEQWGNITSGTELVRRKASGEAYALTCPLLLRSDGKKFGKSEGGESVWLDRRMTTPYRFYQYWLNCTDELAPRLLRMFTLLSRSEIEALEAEHQQAPHQRIMQKALGKDVTIRVHSEADYQAAVSASQILFGGGTTEQLQGMQEADLVSVFEGVPRFYVDRDRLSAGLPVVDLLAVETKVFASKGEARRMLQGGGVGINKSKVGALDVTVGADSLLHGKYLVVQKGKKNYVLVIAR